MWNQGWTTSKISLFWDELNRIEQFSAKHEWKRPPNMHMAGNLLATRIILQVFGDICITTMTSNDGSAAEKNTRDRNCELHNFVASMRHLGGWVSYSLSRFICFVFAPKATGTDMSFENYLISSISKLKFAFLSLQCPLKKDSPSNAVNATECYRQGLFSLCETMQRGTENFGWFRHVGRWTGDMWPWQLGNGWCFLL